MFDHLEYCLKGQRRVLKLAKCTAFIGQMGAGKTTALDAIRLATSGHYPRGNRKQDLAELGDECFTIIRGPAGSGSWNQRTFAGCEGKVCTPDIPGESSETRAELFKRFGGSVSVTLTPDETRALNGRPYNAETLAALGSEVRSLGLQCGQLERRIAELKTNPLLGGAECIPELQAELKAAREVEHVRKRNAEAAAKNAAILGARKTLESFGPVDDGPLHAELADLVKRHDFGAKVLEMLAPARDSNTCPVCRSGFDAAKKWNEVQSIVEERKRQIQDLRVRIQEHDQLYSGRKQLERTAQWALTPIEDVSEATRSAQHIELEIQNLQRAVQVENEIRDLRTKLAEMRNTQELLKSCAKQLTEAIAASLRTVKVEAERQVNAFMPPNFKAELILTDKECRWGMVGNGEARSVRVACESQRTALMIAVAAAFGARIILLDDHELAGFSAQGVRELTAKLAAKVETGELDQVIITRHSDRADEVAPQFFKVNFDEVEL